MLDSNSYPERKLIEPKQRLNPEEQLCVLWSMDWMKLDEHIRKECPYREKLHTYKSKSNYSIKGGVLAF